jgi:hypothetical protein
MTIDIVRRKFRSPKRLTITVPYLLNQQLQERALEEGRSVSNLCSLLLELSFSNPITKHYQQ